MPKQRTVTDKEIISEIVEVLEQLDGDDLADVHNYVCANEAEYVEDNMWLIKVLL
jgi:hypothetical protein